MMRRYSDTFAEFDQYLTLLIYHHAAVHRPASRPHGQQRAKHGSARRYFLDCSKKARALQDPRDDDAPLHTLPAKACMYSKLAQAKGAACACGLCLARPTPSCQLNLRAASRVGCSPKLLTRSAQHTSQFRAAGSAKGSQAVHSRFRQPCPAHTTLLAVAGARQAGVQWSRRRSRRTLHCKQLLTCRRDRRAVWASGSYNPASPQ